MDDMAPLRKTLIPANTNPQLLVQHWKRNSIKKLAGNWAWQCKIKQERSLPKKLPQFLDWNCSTHLHRSSLLLLYMVWKNCGELHGEHHTYTSASAFLSAAAAKKKAPPPVQQQHSIFFASGQASGWSDIEKIKTSHYKSQKNVHSAKLGGDSPKKEINAVLQNELPKTGQFSSLTKCARAHTYPSPWA